MSNENVKKGLEPMPDNKGFIDCRYLVPISASVNTVNDLFAGGPYKIHSAGTLIAAVAGDSELIAGSIVQLYDSNKRKVTNLPKSTAGYADVTYLASQRYTITVSGTEFADDGSNNGFTYNITDEGGTASANGFDGSSYSTIQLDGSTEHASNCQIRVSKKVEKPDNVGGVTGTLVECTIDSANWQQW